MFRGDSVFRGDSSQLTGSEVLGTRIVGAYTLVIYTSLDNTVLSVYCSSRVRCGLGAHTLECLVHAGVSIFIFNNLSFIRVELKAASAFYNSYGTRSADWLRHTLWFLELTPRVWSVFVVLVGGEDSVYFQRLGRRVL